MTEIDPLPPAYRIPPGRPVGGGREIRRLPGDKREDSRRKPREEPGGRRDQDSGHVDEYA
jgi:hypothetical protein